MIHIISPPRPFDFSFSNLKSKSILIISPQSHKFHYSSRNPFFILLNFLNYFIQQIKIQQKLINRSIDQQFYFTWFLMGKLIFILNFKFILQIKRPNNFNQYMFRASIQDSPQKIIGQQQQKPDQNIELSKQLYKGDKIEQGRQDYYNQIITQQYSRQDKKIMSIQKIVQCMRKANDLFKNLIKKYNQHEEQILFTVFILISIFLFINNKNLLNSMICTFQQTIRCTKHFFQAKDKQVPGYLINFFIDGLLFNFQALILITFIKKFLRLKNQNNPKGQVSKKYLIQLQTFSEHEKQSIQTKSNYEPTENESDIKIQIKNKKGNQSIFIRSSMKILAFVVICQVVLIVQFYQMCLGQYHMNLTQLTVVIKVGHRIMIFVSLLILGIIYLFVRVVRLYKRNKKKGKIVVGLTIIVIAILFVTYKLYDSDCSDHFNGINGIVLNDGPCKVIQNKCGFMKIGTSIDLNFLMHNCMIGDQYKQTLQAAFPYSNNITDPTKNIIGFANLKDKTRYQRSNNILKGTMRKYAKRYSSVQEMKKSGAVHDVLLDIDKQEYIIDVKRNQTLVEQKKKMWKENIQNNLKKTNNPSAPLSKNVLIIFIDAVSRFQSHRAFPKITSWFKKFSKQKSYQKTKQNEQEDQRLKNQKASQKAQGEAYESYKFHALGYLTNQNVWDISFGHKQSFFENATKQTILEYNKDEFPNSTVFHHFSEYYGKRGYITGSSSTYCAISSVDQWPNEEASTAIPTFDHQTVSFGCDANFFHEEYVHSYERGFQAATDRCVYGKQMCEYSFQHALSFFKAYKDEPKLYLMNMCEGHDIVGSSVHFIDKPFSNFLTQLQTQGFTKDTTIMIYSDHGHHFGNIQQGVYYFHFLPAFYYYIPPQPNTNYRQALRINQQNLITGKNLFATFQHIAIGQNYNKKSMSIFSDLTFQSSCEIAEIPSFCACKA